MRIALAQINPTVGDLTGNTRKIIDAMAQARAAQADLVVFPEQGIPGYPAEDLLLKKQFARDNIRALDVVRKASKDIAAVVGFIDADKGGSLFNAAAVLRDGRHVTTYHKMFLPNYGVFDEKRYFTPGRKPLLFKADGVSIGLNICEDIWLDEGPTGALAKAGAKIIVNISASPYHMLKGKEREAMLVRRARKHKVWIAYANMVGGQDEILFDGQSVVINPKGRIVARAKAFEEDLLVVDIPLGEKKARAETRKPAAAVLNAHLPVEEEIHKALVLGTRDYVQKNGFEKVVLGLSGGIDSALVAEIAVEALGPKNVIAFFMPSQFSSAESREDAEALAKNLNIRLETVSIDNVFQAYLRQLQPLFSGLPFNIAEENLQARIRGNFLMAFSNKFGWLVLTTGNKSETSVGYCTLYGDMAGGFAVIKDLFKEWVYKLSVHVNAKAGREIIPRRVITKEPTAELRANQRDSDSLPPYPDLDPVLKAYIEKNFGLRDLEKKGFDPKLVRRVVSLVDRNEYKRRQAPPGIKISPLAFGKDRRYPITNRYDHSAKPILG